MEFGAFLRIGHARKRLVLRINNFRIEVAQRLVPIKPTNFGQSGTNGSDYDLNPEIRLPKRNARIKLRPAAVLVPIIERSEGTTVLLTQRTEHLNHHAGQISFPGGRVEPEDTDAVDTALRETEEEIGLDRTFVEVVGQLDIYETVTGFSITPVVGFVNTEFSLSIDGGEVSEAFEIPLDFILNPINHQRHSREFAGARRHYYAMPYQERYIWGATAGMLVNLSKRLDRP